MQLAPYFRRVFGAWRGILALFLILYTGNAYVGQLHNENIDLQQLTRLSTAILIAVPAHPPVVIEQKTFKDQGKDIPPYPRQIYRYRVLENLHGYIPPDTIIEVAPADDSLHENLHLNYYAKGISRHVAIMYYQRRDSFNSDDPRILFLRDHTPRYSFTVSGAEEGISLRKEIDSREAIVDQALMKHGYRGVYGDLRIGLKKLGETCEIKLTNEFGGIRVDIIPRDKKGKRAEGHEYRFLVTPEGTIDDFSAGE